MEDNLKNKIVNGLKNGFKMTTNSVRNIYDKSLSNIAYMTEASLFYVIELDDASSTNKLFNGIFDEKNLILYIKTSKDRAYKDYLKKGCKIQMENKEKKIYNIMKTDFKTNCEYLIKFNDKYKSISCYKIYLEEL